MTSAHELLQEHFAGSLEEGEFVRLGAEALKPHGFTADNTIACVGTCRDEICQTLAVRATETWGEAFNFSSLGGLLFLGVTGFSAAHKHAPVHEGRERYVYLAMPHIGIGAGGEPGVCDRVGRPGKSVACGALSAFAAELQRTRVAPGLDRDDPEQSLLRERLGAYVTSTDIPDLLRLTQLAERAVVEDLERMIGLTVDTNKADYAVFVGTQVHLPGQPNRVCLRRSYAVVSGERHELELSAKA